MSIPAPGPLVGTNVEASSSAHTVVLKFGLASAAELARDSESPAPTQAREDTTETERNSQLPLVVVVVVIASRA